MSARPPRDGVSRVAAGLAVALVLTALGAVFAAWLERVPGELGFRVLLGATVGAVVVFVLGLVGAWRCRGGRRAGRGRALASAGVAAVGVIAVIASALGALRAPTINDVTTDLSDPPSFAAEGRAAEAARARGQSLAYPVAFAPLQRTHYPDLDTLWLDGTVSAVGARVEQAMRELDWVRTYRSADGLHFEAMVRSRVFRFVDDVVVRLRERDGRVGLDIRSRSRVGKSDLGANAARIRAFTAALG